MSVISVEPISSRASSIDQEFTKKYTIKYRVITDNKLDAGFVVRTSVPYSIGDQYVFGAEFDTAAYCLDIGADEEPDGQGVVWVVTCEFGRRPQNELEENPLNQPWDIQYSGTAVEVPFQIDVNGRAVCNTVGDPFSTEIMRQTNQPVLSITRNEASISPAAINFANTVNADVFQGAPPGTVLMMPITAQSQNSPTYGRYYSVQYNFIYNGDGWTKRIINQGFRARNARGVLKNILIQGTMPSEPVLLTWSGDVLPQGVPPVVLEFYPYNRMPFSVLGLS